MPKHCNMKQAECEKENVTLCQFLTSAPDKGGLPIHVSATFISRPRFPQLESQVGSTCYPVTIFPQWQREYFRKPLPGFKDGQ
jgi:hypothetical protein